MLNPQIKKTIVDALMKVVDSAPSMSNRQNKSNTFRNYPRNYYQTGERYRPGYMYQSDMIHQSDVSNENFEVWINYVLSVLKITAQQVDPNLSYTVYQQVQNIVHQGNSNNSSKTIGICRILLDYAQDILKL